jgi:GTP cyclohydrolase II
LSIRFVASAKLPTELGDFMIHGFEDTVTGKEHIVLGMGDLSLPEPVLCRLHSECLTGDALFSMRCDCGPQLHFAMKKISEQGRGMILYLRQEGRGIGLLNKVRAYSLQDRGADTVEANEQLGFAADGRDYDLCKPIFEHFGVGQVRLMTNNPLKVDALSELGVEVVERVPIEAGHNLHNEDYLEVKGRKMGHLFRQ